MMLQKPLMTFQVDCVPPVRVPTQPRARPPRSSDPQPPGAGADILGPLQPREPRVHGDGQNRGHRQQVRIIHRHKRHLFMIMLQVTARGDKSPGI